MRTEDYMTIEEVAQYTNRSIETLRYWMRKKDGFPKRITILGKKVFLRKEIERYKFKDERYGS